MVRNSCALQDCVDFDENSNNKGWFLCLLSLLRRAFLFLYKVYFFSKRWESNLVTDIFFCFSFVTPTAPRIQSWNVSLQWPGRAIRGKQPCYVPHRDMWTDKEWEWVGAWHCQTPNRWNQGTGFTVSCEEYRCWASTEKHPGRLKVVVIFVCMCVQMS